MRAIVQRCTPSPTPIPPSAVSYETVQYFSTTCVISSDAGPPRPLSLSPPSPTRHIFDLARSATRSSSVFDHGDLSRLPLPFVVSNGAIWPLSDHACHLPPTHACADSLPPSANSNEAVWLVFDPLACLCHLAKGGMPSARHRCDQPARVAGVGW